MEAPDGRIAAVVACVLLAGCGGSPNPPTPGTPGTGGETITGRERIGWSQQASDAAELATFDYAIYIDGVRQVLSGDSCSPAGAGFDCAAPLPPLGPGQHTIELSAFVTAAGGLVIESGRSAPLRVTVAGSAPPADLAPPQDSTISTSDGHRLRASIVASGLDDPTDLAAAPDGRVFITERAGRVRIAGDRGLDPRPALALADVAAGPDSGLTAIALHPDFDRTGHVYVVYGDEGRDGPTYRIARFRERGGLLAQGAIVSRERTSLLRHAIVRFGSDGRLYAAFPAGRDPRDAQDPSSALGKILRLNDDGSTPRDNPRPSPAFSWGHRDSRALMWRDGVLWQLDRDPEAGDELNAIHPGSDYGWPIARGRDRAARSVPAALVLPPGTDVSGGSVVPAASHSPLAGDLLVASRGAEDLLRIRVNGGEAGLVEALLQGRYGRIAAVHVLPDGTILFATANRDTWGPMRDVLVAMSSPR